MKSCLHKVVGISTRECNCLPDTEIDVRTSWSGLYMDNIEHGIPLKLNDSLDCGDNSIWDIMDKARLEAVDDFMTQFMIELSTYNKSKYAHYNGSLGEKSKNGNASRSGLNKINGVSIFPRNEYRGNSLCITDIGIGINKNGTYNVHVINVDTKDVIKTVDVVVSDRAYGNTITDITLPLSDHKGDAIRYAVVYDKKGGTPKDYKYHCGCTSVPRPRWMDENFINSKGISVSSMNAVTVDKFNSDYSNGLIVCFEVVCDPFEWMCNVKPSFWKISHFGRMVAKIIQLIANKKLVSYILNLNDPSYYTLLGREALYGKRNHFNKLSNDLITLIATKDMPDQMRHCYTCDPRNSGGFSKQEIIV